MARFSRGRVEVALRRGEVSSRNGYGGSSPSERKGLSQHGYGLRNSASGPDIGLPGRILAGLLLGKHRHGPSGRPKGRFLCFPGSSPAKIRPGRPIFGPEALLRKIEFPQLYLRTLFILFLPTPPPVGPGAGSGLSCPSGDRRFWADPGPDPGSNVI